LLKRPVKAGILFMPVVNHLGLYEARIVYPQNLTNIVQKVSFTWSILYHRMYMEDKHALKDHLPVYNIKAVSRLVGLLPVTLRAWERRYGIPNPGRGNQGYRLYSEQDVRTLRWLKAQVDSGLSIGRAVDYLNELRQSGQDPTAEPAVRYPRRTEYLPGAPGNNASSPTILRLKQDFFEALLDYDESRALEVMRRAFTIYSVDQVLAGVVEPTLVEIGEAWHRGELPIATEHYATQFCMQHLMSMMAAAAPPNRPGVIVAACAPGEMHQIGLLMLVVMLRWRGWDVKFFGPDLPLDRLAEVLMLIRPAMIMFSANRFETARALQGLPKIIATLPEPHPIMVFGGQAFLTERLPESVPAVYVNATPAETVEKIQQLMTQGVNLFKDNGRHQQE
jgi:MerR family transcriptional regulator, light-induced transcriptional regulator